jgi:hypothetical protein
VIKLSLFDTVLQTAPSFGSRPGMGGGSFIFQAITAVSILLVAVGIFYVLVKLGSFIDAMKEKTETSSAKK